MIEPEEIDAFAAQMGVHQANVERDYVFGWLLKAFFENDYRAPPDLQRRQLHAKGFLS